jgi:hypothetical protein
MSVWPCLKCKVQTHISLLEAGICLPCYDVISQRHHVEEDSATDSIDRSDIINKPKHYNFATIEPIDVIEDWKLDFRLANALKYISRAGKKDPTKTREDLQKAIWYINRYIIKECSDVQQAK